MESQTRDAGWNCKQVGLKINKCGWYSDREHTGRWGTRERFWRRQRVHRCKWRKRSTAQLSSDSPILLVSGLKLSVVVQLVAFRLHFQFFIPALPSRRRHLRLSKRVVPGLYFKTAIPIFRLFCGRMVVGINRIR